MNLMLALLLTFVLFCAIPLFACAQEEQDTLTPIFLGDDDLTPNDMIKSEAARFEGAATIFFEYQLHLLAAEKAANTAALYHPCYMLGKDGQILVAFRGSEKDDMLLLVYDIRGNSVANRPFSSSFSTAPTILESTYDATVYTIDEKDWSEYYFSIINILKSSK